MFQSFKHWYLIKNNESHNKIFIIEPTCTIAYSRHKTCKNINEMVFLSPFGVAFICIIHSNYRGRGRGSGVVGYLIAWYNWRSTLLVADVCGVRLPDFLTEAYFGMGWDGGGARLGRGECTSISLVYIFVSLCLSMPDCDIDFCS